MAIPKGKLIPIGGHEARQASDETDPDRLQPVRFVRGGVLREVLNESIGKESRVLVITAASEAPEEMGELYREAFGALGCPHVDVLVAKTKAEADRPEHLDQLAAADIVFLTGGDQAYLATVFGGTQFLKHLHERYQREPIVVAGTSAGAMILSKYLLDQGAGTEPFLKGLVETARGFGLLPEAVVDTHFLARGRLSRLVEAVLKNPECVGVGLCEDTGLVITEGRLARTIGSGSVVVFETDSGARTNYAEARKYQPVFVENLRMRVLAKGTSYDLRERQFLVNEQEATLLPEP